jgi:hypothetical protein
MTGLLDLLDPDQHEEVSRAGRAELEAALNRRTKVERDTFWKALDLYYAPPPKEENDPCKPLRQSPVQSEDAGAAVSNVGSLHRRLAPW